MKIIKLYGEKVRHDAKPIRRANVGALGDDVAVCLDKPVVTLGPYEFMWMPTGWKFQYQEGWGCDIKPRSSNFALRLGIFPGTGDNFFSGEYMIGVENLTNTPIDIEDGDYLAQLVPREVVITSFTEVEELRFTNLTHTGFGSTGRK